MSFAGMKLTFRERKNYQHSDWEFNACVSLVLHREKKIKWKNMRATHISPNDSNLVINDLLIIGKHINQNLEMDLVRKNIANEIYWFTNADLFAYFRCILLHMLPLLLRLHHQNSVDGWKTLGVEIAHLFDRTVLSSFKFKVTLIIL